ncbi:MAG: hypothetical protein PHW36_03525, partial [Bacilli bacterium]|nr:hypothetical protein [Bacilli bacterium]
AINSPLLEASINGARRAICSVTCGPNVSLYEAQEAVDLVIEAAGNNIDVKFGVAINNQLTDQILVSVIASDFTEEFDFTSVPNYSQQIRLQRADGEKVNGASDDKPKKEAKEAETEAGEAASEDSILPSFLKNRHID